MAPDKVDDKLVEQQIKDVIQDLYQIMVQVSAYDLTSRPSKEVLEQAIIGFQRSLQRVHATSSATPLPSIPPELIQYVDNGRNPDIYTREFVERTKKMNQTMKGKIAAFGDFRDVLATEMARAMPEVREDVAMVVEKTGGDKDRVMRDSE
ncbi:Mediator of RNA polymerase II transcription subunit 10 [Phlyctema vagabunda]|uniref:Mediator of RNA polymerase II transcription subunit 10 n=1 Tax=Phlyctema vagabunda TaxID=108571 RepID=A0ABR4PTW5_9HELO